MQSNNNTKSSIENFPKKSDNRYYLSLEENSSYPVPHLNDMQERGFNFFFQEGTDPFKRQDIGLQYLFNSIFPFTSNDGRIRVDFSHYTVGEKPYSKRDAILKDKSYVVPIQATIKIFFEDTEEEKEQEIFISDFPCMTDDGTFVINGDERAVVSQIRRSPGVVFDFNNRLNIYHSRLIPEKGPWIEFEIIRDVVYVRIDRKAKIPVTLFLKALGYEKNQDIIRALDFEVEAVGLSNKDEKELEDILLDRRLAEDFQNASGEIKIKAGVRLSTSHIKTIKESEVLELGLVKESNLGYREIFNTFDKDSEDITQAEACRYFYYIVRGVQAPNVELALNEIITRYECVKCNKKFDQYQVPEECPNCDNKSSFNRIDKSVFFNPEFYLMGKVGRYKINKKFNYSEKIDNESLEVADILNTVKHLLKVKYSVVNVDDIDHLGNRRIRRVGEQLVDHLKTAFARLKKLAKERMSIEDVEGLTPQSLISIKPITAGLNEFYGVSQLSQFMDQTNPLSAITHKRRISSLGQGGLTRERAGFEVRDIHYTHYGRICPIETPEGPNIGLIVSMACFAQINEYGFIETPYYEIKKRKLTGKVKYLSAIEEENYIICSSDTVIENGAIKDEQVAARNRGNYNLELADNINYMDVSAKQTLSLSACLIPFLEHDDANRALMGCNMMRQSVPLLIPEAPIVGTGIEEKIASESGFCVLAKGAGKVTYVDNKNIEITSKDGLVFKHELVKSYKTNQGVYFNQRPIVREGDKVKKDQVISSGPCIDKNELALGKNVVVAFMCWEGYNFEDAILMSEKLLKDDAYTSINIEEFEIESRETKLGKEEITRDIPNLAEEEYRELDDDGIIHVGSYVKTGNVLVGKTTPKSHTEITPEFRLLYSIFGEKAKDVKDTSLRVPHGTEGVVIDVQRYHRSDNFDLKSGVIEKIKVLIAKKRKLKEGDKFAGRHGNKGVVAKVIPEEDMPFMEDGTPVDIVLNPLGVPSRMNIGQVMETIMGLIARKSGEKVAVPLFNSINYNEIKAMLKKDGFNEDGKTVLYDGRTGEKFLNRVTVGVMYYLKLSHLADDKLHARSTGPYSLITQQPLGGKAQFGGQRVGEMEVWAIEAYGASNILQEFLTVKSDAIEGRTKIYESIVRGDFVSNPGIPESFNVLVNELRGLGIDIRIYDNEDREVDIFPIKNKITL